MNPSFSPMGTVVIRPCGINPSLFSAELRDVNEIIFELDAYKSIFVGHSVRSMIGMLAANERPENFSSLIMFAPSPCYLNTKHYKGGYDLSDILKLLENLDSNFSDWSLAMSRPIMGNPDRPQLADDLRSSFCKVEPRVMKHFAELTFLSDLRDELKKSHVPSLILQCTEDNIASEEVGKFLHQNLKKSDFIQLKAKGLCPHMSEPVETAVAILDFLERRKSLKIST